MIKALDLAHDVLGRSAGGSKTKTKLNTRNSKACLSLSVLHITSSKLSFFSITNPVCVERYREFAYSTLKESTIHLMDRFRLATTVLFNTTVRLLCHHLLRHALHCHKK